MTPPEITRVADRSNPEKWAIRVIPNKYPLSDRRKRSDSARRSVSKMDGVGAHEVIIESPNPEFKLQCLANASPDILKTYRNRMADLAQDSRFVSTILFEIRVHTPGTTVAHGHAQLIALPLIPPQLQVRLDASRAHFETSGQSLFEDLIAHEESSGDRMVCSAAGFVSFAPYTSRSPFELMILPRHQAARFEQCTDDELTAFASILAESLRRLEAYLGNFDYNLMIQSAPRSDADVPWYRWHVQIVPRLTQVAGFEWATNFFINPMAPESAAESLRRIRLA